MISEEQRKYEYDNGYRNNNDQKIYYTIQAYDTEEGYVSYEYPKYTENLSIAKEWFDKTLNSFRKDNKYAGHLLRIAAVTKTWISSRQEEMYITIMILKIKSYI